MLAVLVYTLATGVFLLTASPRTLATHTPANHFALLAEAWLHGHLSLPGEPPAYARGNDFAYFDGRWYVTFPPFPAALLVPAVWLAGGEAARVADGRIFVLLAGVAPAVLFLVLEKLRRMRESRRSERQNVVLSLLFAFGTVYFFSAVQGTVWYAAHAVAAALAALYLLFALDAERPLLAGVVLGLGFLTRAPLILGAPLLLFELYRVHGAGIRGKGEGWGHFVKALACFAAPLVSALALALVLNQLRFGDWSDFGYRHLAIRWHGRIERWGLFHYHYLAKNLGVLLTSLPWLTPAGAPVPFRINAHGLALWFTTPLYFWLLWPRRCPPLYKSLALTALLVALPTLFYQNTGWVQFGFRFSNDYAVFLFALLALAGNPLGRLWQAAAIVSVSVNAFGAFSFGRSAYAAFYYVDPTQRVLYQPD